MSYSFFNDTVDDNKLVKVGDQYLYYDDMSSEAQYAASMGGEVLAPPTCQNKSQYDWRTAQVLFDKGIEATKDVEKKLGEIKVFMDENLVDKTVMQAVTCNATLTSLGMLIWDGHGNVDSIKKYFVKYNSIIQTMMGEKETLIFQHEATINNLKEENKKLTQKIASMEDN